VAEAHDLLLDDYLLQLGRAARKLPGWQRTLFLAEIADQIDDDLQAGGPVDLDRMHAVLDELGDPEILVRTGETIPDWPAGPELATVLVLLAGGVVVPVIGWIVGVALLWASPRWRLGDKLLGTFIWPGGLAGLAWLGLAAGLSSRGPAPIAWQTVIAPAVILGIPPVLVAIRLLHTARRPARRRLPGRSVRLESPAGSG
jgi:hypothetical protein